MAEENQPPEPEPQPEPEPSPTEPDEKPQKEKGKFWHYAAAGVGAAYGLHKSRRERRTSRAPIIRPAAITGILLAVIIYIYDLLIRFGGLNVDAFVLRVSFSTIIDLLKVSINVGVIVFLVAYFVIKRPSPREFDSYAALVISLSLVLTMGGFGGGGFLHIVLLLIFYLFFVTRATDDITYINYVFAGLLLFDFIGHGMFAYYFPGSVIANRLIFPIWIYFAIALGRNLEKGMLTAIFIIVIITSNILLFGTGFYNYRTALALGPDILEEDVIVEAKAQAQTVIGRFKTSIGDVMDQIACSTKTDFAACITGRRFTRECTTEGYLTGSTEFQNCKAEKQEEIVSGTTDETVKEYITIEFSSEEFPREYIDTPLPMSVEINAPNKEIDLKFSCSFKRGSEEFEGTLESENELIGVIGTDQETTIICDLPEDPIEGSHRAIFGVEVQDIETKSISTKMYVGKDVTKERRTQLETLHPNLIQGGRSKAADEFVVFSIGIGKTPTNNFIDDTTLTLIGNLENKAQGKIISVDSARIELPQGISPTQGCLKSFDYSGNVLVAKQSKLDTLKNIEQGKKPPMITCTLEVSSTLIPEGEDEGRETEFRAFVTYDYKLTQTENFEVISYV